MRVRWLGWAGIEIEADGAAVVIDPLVDPGATFAALGEEAGRVELPAVVAPGDRPVRADRTARRRWPRRSPGLLARRGRGAEGPAPRRHDLPRLLVADGSPP